MHVDECISVCLCMYLYLQLEENVELEEEGIEEEGTETGKISVKRNPIKQRSIRTRQRIVIQWEIFKAPSFKVGEIILKDLEYNL